MKTHETTKKKFGFFDFGLSLLILAIAGGSAYFIERNEAEKYALQREETGLAVNRQTATTVATLEAVEASSVPADQQ